MDYRAFYGPGYGYPATPIRIDAVTTTHVRSAPAPRPDSLTKSP